MIIWSYFSAHLDTESVYLSLRVHMILAFRHFNTRRISRNRLVVTHRVTRKWCRKLGWADMRVIMEPGRGQLDRGLCLNCSRPAATRGRIHANTNVFPTNVFSTYVYIFQCALRHRSHLCRMSNLENLINYFARTQWSNGIKRGGCRSIQSGVRKLRAWHRCRVINSSRNAKSWFLLNV